MRVETESKIFSPHVLCQGPERSAQIDRSSFQFENAIAKSSQLVDADNKKKIGGNFCFVGRCRQDHQNRKRAQRIDEA
jgi:hypothetical protein